MNERDDLIDRTAAVLASAVHDSGVLSDKEQFEAVFTVLQAIWWSLPYPQDMRVLDIAIGSLRRMIVERYGRERLPMHLGWVPDIDGDAMH